jgi:cobalt-zinc-cadmium efflux system membrane fusion protein
LFVTAEIPTDETSAAIVVAKTALQTVKGDTVVFVRTENGFEVRKIGVGRQDARLVEVTEGLVAGERVATSNTFVLKAELGKAEAGHDD